jgi:hypothetical protein
MSVSVTEWIVPTDEPTKNKLIRTKNDLNKYEYRKQNRENGKARQIEQDMIYPRPRPRTTYGPVPSA